MSNLSPTRTRLDLLSDVADGLVVWDKADSTIWREERLAGFCGPFTATRTRVTSRARELENARWIERDHDGVYHPTEAGQAVKNSSPNTGGEPSGGLQAAR